MGFERSTSVMSIYVFILEWGFMAVYSLFFIRKNKLFSVSL